MFRSPRNYRTFLTILLTYTLDLVGYSIVFPVLAPLLLNPELHFFTAGTTVAEKTTILGLLYAFFGIAQFFGAPAAGALEGVSSLSVVAFGDYFGRFSIESRGAILTSILPLGFRLKIGSKEPQSRQTLKLLTPS